MWHCRHLGLSEDRTLPAAEAVDMGGRHSPIPQHPPPKVERSLMPRSSNRMKTMLAGARPPRQFGPRAGAFLPRTDGWPPTPDAAAISSHRRAQQRDTVEIGPPYRGPNCHHRHRQTGFFCQTALMRRLSW